MTGGEAARLLYPDREAQVGSPGSISKGRLEPTQDPRRAQPGRPTLWRCSLDLLAEPPQEVPWLLKGILPAGSVVLFSGREGTHKTWLALDWAYAVAEGQPWIERLAEAGAVLYLDGEMPDNLFRLRLQAVRGSKNLNIWRWQDEGFPTTLADPRLLEASKSHRLIVVDTLKRFMGGLEENSSTEMARITGALRELTREGATVLALHHAPKDPEKAGYRGSTELGAGVDIALTVTRVVKNGTDHLDLTANKTRYSEDPRLQLRVERTESRPIFHDASGEVTAAVQTALAAELEALGGVIRDLAGRDVVGPNQSKIIAEAQRRKLGSRNTILGWLRQGEGTRWQAQPDGRSLVYSPIVQLSTCPGSRGADRLDNRHQAASGEEFQPETVPVGAVVWFDGGLGRDETGTVEAVTGWPQYPGEPCYRLSGGRTIPHSWVVGVEGTP